MKWRTISVPRNTWNIWRKSNCYYLLYEIIVVTQENEKLCFGIKLLQVSVEAHCGQKYISMELILPTVKAVAMEMECIQNIIAHFKAETNENRSCKIDICIIRNSIFSYFCENWRKYFEKRTKYHNKMFRSSNFDKNLGKYWNSENKWKCESCLLFFRNCNQPLEIGTRLAFHSSSLRCNPSIRC